MSADQCDPARPAATASAAPWLRRRRFLTLAALAAFGVTRARTTAAALAFPVPCLPSPDLLALLGGTDAVRHLGERYRQLVPDENDADALVTAIVGRPKRLVLPDLAAAVSEQVTQDFTHRRTVTVRGWILAVTEARQCALYSLHHA